MAALPQLLTLLLPPIVVPQCSTTHTQEEHGEPASPVQPSSEQTQTEAPAICPPAPRKKKPRLLPRKKRLLTEVITVSAAELDAAFRKRRTPAVEPDVAGSSCTASEASSSGGCKRMKL
jgi:hypothetical protein